MLPSVSPPEPPAPKVAYRAESAGSPTSRTCVAEPRRVRSSAGKGEIAAEHLDNAVDGEVVEDLERVGYVVEVAPLVPLHSARSLVASTSSREYVGMAAPPANQGLTTSSGNGAGPFAIAGNTDDHFSCERWSAMNRASEFPNAYSAHLYRFGCAILHLCCTSTPSLSYRDTPRRSGPGVGHFAS